MNRNSSFLPCVSGAKIGPESVEEHMARARRLHDEAVADFVVRGATRVAHGISKFVWACLAVYRRVLSQGSQANSELGSSQPQGATAKAGPGTDQPSPVVNARDEVKAVASGKPERKRPGWHLAPKLDKRRAISEMGGQHV